MITVTMTGHGELIAQLDRLPKRIRSAIELKMKSVMDVIYAKAVDQFSAGKYQATEEITHGVDVSGSMVIGYIEPLTIKAKVQETGGSGYYEIVPVKARLLRFIGSRDGKIVMTSYVNHPPLAGKHYIENSLIEMYSYAEGEFDVALEEAASDG